jgi:hypothetical protein
MQDSITRGIYNTKDVDLQDPQNPDRRSRTPSRQTRRVRPRSPCQNVRKKRSPGQSPLHRCLPKRFVATRSPIGSTLTSNRPPHRRRHSIRPRWHPHNSHQTPAYRRPRRRRPHRRPWARPPPARPSNPPRYPRRHPLQLANLSALCCLPRWQGTVLLGRWHWVVETDEPSTS